MNVKKQMFENNNKQNLFTNLITQKSISSNKQRTNIGQQIRKKLKINTPTVDTSSVLMPRNQNIIRQSIFKPQITTKIQRVPLLQRSVQICPETSRSVKSVRFDDRADESKLNRKHSTSSILKNNKVTKKPRFSDKLSMNNSVCSNILKDDQSTQNLSYNKISKEKYQRLLEGLKKNQKKYFDQLFPQVWSSISRCNQPALKQLKWMRLSQLFQGKYLTVWDSNQTIKIQPGQYSRSYIQSNCYNSIKYNNFILQKMFQSQSFNPYGIYYVKINQNNTWKYIVVDDYIPVYKSDKKFIPAFLNSVSTNPNHVQLWPFLIQKAYAKYYSNYECLDLGEQVDFMQQLTGCYPQQKDPKTHDFQQILHQINNYDSILIAKDYTDKFHPIVPRKSSLTCQNTSNNYINQTYTPEQFKQKFSKVYCILLHKYFYSGFCTIKYNKNRAQSTNNNNYHTSIRSIKVDQPTQCIFSLGQKDQKHYYLSDYQYVWVRVIVVMKQSQKNYRWVVGLYQNVKYANLSVWLEPAQYLIFVIPQWKGKGYDLNLTFQGNIKVNIDRKPYVGNQDILIQAAMDLAQSKGKLKQLNPNICTYSFIDYKIGLIIENINNERPNGFIRILRSIEGLQKCGNNVIWAINKQFMFNPTVQVKIQSLQHFTVVLAVQGGLNKGFLQQFDFGS